MGVCWTQNSGPSKVDLRNADNLDEKSALEFIEECAQAHDIEGVIQFIEDDRYKKSLHTVHMAFSWVENPCRIGAFAMFYLYEYFSDPIMHRNKENPEIIKKTRLIKRVIQNLKSTKLDIQEMALCLISTIVTSKNDRKYLDILSARENYTILFDLLEDVKNDKRVILSKLIRNWYFDNSAAIENAKPYMQRYLKILPALTNSSNCLKHLKYIGDFYKPNGQFNQQNFEHLVKWDLRKYWDQLKLDQFEKIPSLTADWTQIITLTWQLWDKKERRSGGIDLHDESMEAYLSTGISGNNKSRKDRTFFKQTEFVNLESPFTQALNRKFKKTENLRPSLEDGESQARANNRPKTTELIQNPKFALTRQKYRKTKSKSARNLLDMGASSNISKRNLLDTGSSSSASSILNKSGENQKKLIPPKLARAGNQKSSAGLTDFTPKKLERKTEPFTGYTHSFADDNE